ncbi:MAG: hypothetical protein JSW62_06095 [Thermoplasmatales archaeon]|nr:MAG: hypothetical protein JSW62_06095 [Thermoplasmatales archaeon]
MKKEYAGEIVKVKKRSDNSIWDVPAETAERWIRKGIAAAVKSGKKKTDKLSKSEEFYQNSFEE